MHASLREPPLQRRFPDLRSAAVDALHVRCWHIRIRAFPHASTPVCIQMCACVHRLPLVRFRGGLFLKDGTPRAGLR